MQNCKEYSVEEVAQHNTDSDCWLILGEDERLVYDITSFLDEHPGGPQIILDVAGQDANDDFEDIGHSTDARNMLESYLVGKIKKSSIKKAPLKNISPTNNGASICEATNPKTESLLTKSFFFVPFMFLVAAMLYKYGQ